ncbi:MAG: flippase, partial [Ktedonobacterales bacterium]
DPALALSMGERGQAHVHSQFALSNTTAQFFQVLHELELQSGQHSGVLQNTSMYVRAVHRARFMGQSALFLLSKVLTAAATAIWTILSAGVLTQTAYGNLMLGMGMLDIFAAVNDAGITTLATREAAQAKQSELPALTGTVLLIKLMLGVCSTLLVLGIAALFPFSAQAKYLITLLAPSLIFSAMLSLSLMFRARSLLWQIVTVTCCVSVASIALTIVAATHNGSVTTFALIELGTTVLSGILMLILVGVQFKPRLRPDLRRMRQLAISAIPYGVSLTLVYLYYRIDVPLLAVLGGANEVAVYTSAYRILDVITLLPAAASGIALAEMAKLAKEPDRKYLVKFSQQYLELALVIGSLIAVGLTLTGRVILKLLYQGRYDSSYSALSVLAWAGAVSLVTNVFLPLVNALGRRRVLISASLIALAANVGINLFLIPTLGALGAAVATLCTELIVTACYAYVTIRDLQWRLQWRVILSAALATVVALGAEQIFTSLAVPGWLVVVVSLSLWVAVLAVLVPRWIRDLIQTRGNLRRRSGNTSPVSERERELAQIEANQIL